MKRALVTGITGQDGGYLAKLLLDKNYKVFGTYRRLSTPNFWRLQYLGIFEKISLIPCDMLDGYSIIEALKISKPDEIYNLAAQSFVGASFEQPISSAEISGLGLTRLLESVKVICPKSKIYQASTSELYGDNSHKQQNEETIFEPSSPYAAAKLYAHWMCDIYKKSYNIFAANGILFNHESPIRGLEFVTRKISNSVAKIKLGIDDKLVLGNVSAMRDWGFAPDYVEAMWMILQQDEPDNFVVATGKSHSVEDFLDAAFSIVDLDYKNYVEYDKKYQRPLDVNFLKGDASKAKKLLGWSPKTNFNELVEIMVSSDLQRWKMWKRGESFPWDAPNFLDDSKILSRSSRLELD